VGVCEALIHLALCLNICFSRRWVWIH
jgi:hypothetical protein